MTGSMSMVFIDQTVVGVALPVIQRDLGVDQTVLQWIINAYILALASTVALGGRLGDYFGRVRAFIVGIVVFAIASTLCGMAPNQSVLIAARAFQGLGAALMIPSSAAIVIDSFDLRERGKAMAIYAGVSQSFLAVGPLLGGFLTQYLSWRWVFWINLPVGAMAIILTYISKPAASEIARGHVRIRYALILMLGLFLFVFGMQQGHQWGWDSALTRGTIAGGFILLVLFAYTQIRTDKPLIQVKLFKVPAFTADAVLLFCIQFALISIIVFGAIYLQNVLKFTPVETGLAFMPVIISVVIMSQVSGRIFDRVGVRLPALFGTGLLALGFLLQAPFLVGGNFYFILPGMILLGMGVGLIMVPTNTDALNRAPSEFRGQASGVIQTIRQMGGTIGLAAIGGFVATLEDNYISDILVKFTGPVEVKSKISGLLNEASMGQLSAVEELGRGWPDILTQFYHAVSSSIAAGYYFAGGVAVIAFLVAVFMMRSGRQREDG